MQHTWIVADDRRGDAEAAGVSSRAVCGPVIPNPDHTLRQTERTGALSPQYRASYACRVRLSFPLVMSFSLFGYLCMLCFLLITVWGCLCSDVVEVLLSVPGAVDAPDAAGATPLYAMTEADAELMIDILLSHNANPNAVCVNGACSFLLHSISSRRTPVLTRSNVGNTPLHVAARVGNVNVFTSLLETGADPSVPNTNGASSLTLLPCYRWTCGFLFLPRPRRGGPYSSNRTLCLSPRQYAVACVLCVEAGRSYHHRAAVFRGRRCARQGRNDTLACRCKGTGVTGYLLRALCPNYMFVRVFL